MINLIVERNSVCVCVCVCVVDKTGLKSLGNELRIEKQAKLQVRKIDEEEHTTLCPLNAFHFTSYQRQQKIVNNKINNNNNNNKTDNKQQKQQQTTNNNAGKNGRKN